MDPILKRKTARGRAFAAEARGLPSPEVTAALKLAVARAARRAAGLTLTAAAEMAVHALEELPELVPGRALLSLLEGEDESLGLCAMDADLVDALVEMQLTGELRRAAPASRKPTDVDAALARGFLDAGLEIFTHDVGAAGLRPFGGPYRYGSQLADPRPLLQILEEGRYLVATLDLDLEQGVRRGRMMLCLPLTVFSAAASGQEARDGAWSAGLRGSVLSASVTLDAVLHRMHLPLDRVRALDVGDVLEIPAGALEQIRLDACPNLRGSAPGVASLPGRLGQARGHRAVRLTMDPAGIGLAVPQRLGSVGSGREPGQKAALPDLP